MGNIDEHEMLIEYSEMTSFNFKSEEFRKVKEDYADCRDRISEMILGLKLFFKNFKMAN